jgi:uncharacterized protein GlcG (DUF336 family)
VGSRFKPLTFVVPDAGGHLKAIKREDWSSLLRPEIGGKAWGALDMGFGGREFACSAAANPSFYPGAQRCVGRKDRTGGGRLLIRDGTGEIIGAVGIGGGTSQNDERCAVFGIDYAGLVADTGHPG